MNGATGLDRRAKTGWGVLIAALVIETFGGIALLVPITTSMLSAGDDPLGARLSVFVAALISWLWVCITLFGAIRHRANWARGSAITIHVLMFAAGTGMLQLGLGDPLLAWSIIALALIGFAAALLARPVGVDGVAGAAPEPTD